MKILIASNNSHKHREFSELFEMNFPGKLSVLTPRDVLDYNVNVDETLETLEENAYLKAKVLFDLTKIPALADDTALEVDYLQGEPGVKSARFSGVHGDEDANRKKVLHLMQDVQHNHRKARFRTVICFYDGQHEIYFEGHANGEIITEERGTNGFGYDSIFIPDGEHKTFAEMNSNEKHLLSHRGKAMKKVVEYFQKHFY